MVTVPVAMAAHSPPRATARTALTATISRCRSRRSARTPPTRENSSQDSDWTKAAPATSTGSRVREAMSSGPATMVTPSPMVETAEAVQSLVNRGVRMSGHAWKPLGGVRSGENLDHAEAHADSYLATGVSDDGMWLLGDATTPFPARIARDHLPMIIPRP
jgi:hypothetical protein